VTLPPARSCSTPTVALSWCSGTYGIWSPRATSPNTGSSDMNERRNSARVNV
jgi:hypothetical protein